MRVLFSFLLFVSVSVQAKEVDLKAFQKQLMGKGVTGWIHGAAHDLRQYVFTYREPGDFFSHLECNLIPMTKETRVLLSKLDRHDEVWIQGRIAENPSKQPHILVSGLKLLKKFEPGVKVPAFKRTVKLPDEILKGSNLLATVHAVAGDGGILVVEYKDAVLPVFVEDPALAKALYRGDKIRLHYTIQKSPRAPTHLRLAAVKQPVEVLDRIVEQHGKELTLEGALVYFPKSPQIKFPIFAVQVVDSDGLKRNYTLVNFSDMAIFEAIRNKLDAAWTAQAAAAVNGRNCLVNPKLRVRAKGIGNVVSAGQANPQILLDSVKSVEVLLP